MAKIKSQRISAEEIRLKLESLIANFKPLLESGKLREKVLALVPVFRHLRNLGNALIPGEEASNARERILYYFKKYPGIVIAGDELLVVSGIQEYARRIRELRVQFGWKIISGVTAKTMAEEEEVQEPLKTQISGMGPEDYYLASKEQDKESAHRWNVANSIRRKNIGVRERIIEYFKASVGKAISGEELRYLAKDKTEWARRVRELRTEFGWPIVTRNTGRPDLDVGVYVLESSRQSPIHDRKIPDPVRVAVLDRDKHKCTNCGWNHAKSTRSDTRHLELHHKKAHAKGGENTEENLATLCTICHDDVHRKEK